MLDPRQTFIDVTVQLGRDVTLYPGTILEGNTVVGDGCEIGPDTRLDDCVVGRGLPRQHTVGRGGRDRRRAPGSARSPTCRPGSHVAAGAVTGAFYTAPPTEHGAGAATRRRRRWRRSRPRSWRCTRGGPTPSSPRRSPSHLGIELGHPNIVEFANGEVRPRFAESVRGNDVFILQSHYGIDGRSVNDSIMEQLIMCDAAYRASAKRITAVCPFYGYARQDRKAEGREPITARLVADMFKAAGAKRMISIDLHAGQIQGFFDGPVDHLTAMPVLEDYLREHADEPVIVSPDAGRIKVAERMAQHLGDCGADLAFCYKRRPKGTTNVAEAHRGHRRGQGPAVRAHRRHDRHRRHDHLGRRAAAASGAPPRCGRWRPTACCRARRSTA